MVSEAEIRERAWVEHRRPPIDPIDEPLWVAEDPETDCVGVGRVEAEAVGNLVSVVEEFETREGRRPLMRVPGRTVTRPSSGDDELSVLDRIRLLF